MRAWPYWQRPEVTRWITVAPADVEQHRAWFTDPATSSLYTHHGPLGRRLGRSHREQDAVVGDQRRRELLVGGHLHAVLLPERAVHREVAEDVREDLHRARHAGVSVTRGIVDDQLDARIAAEDLELHAVAGGADEEPLSIPEEPVRRQVRPAIPLHPGNDDVAGFGQEAGERGHGQ